MPLSENLLNELRGMIGLAGGVASGGSNTTLEDASKNWETNHWVGADIQIIKDGTEYIRAITANTDTTITFAALPGGVVAAADDMYSIRRGPGSAPPGTIVDALEIRDTNAHDPSTDAEISFADVHEWRGWALKVTNDLDEDIVLTLYGNLTNSTVGADDYADTLSVVADGVGHITFHGARSPWTPWIYASLQCSVAPTSGSVTIEIVKFDGMCG